MHFPYVWSGVYLFVEIRNEAVGSALNSLRQKLANRNWKQALLLYRDNACLENKKAHATMFTQLAYRRRPTITYKRKIRFRCAPLDPDSGSDSDNDAFRTNRQFKSMNAALTPNNIDVSQAVQKNETNTTDVNSNALLQITQTSVPDAPDTLIENKLMPTYTQPSIPTNLENSESTEIANSLQETLDASHSTTTVDTHCAKKQNHETLDDDNVKGIVDDVSDKDKDENLQENKFDATSAPSNMTIPDNSNTCDAPQDESFANQSNSSVASDVPADNSIDDLFDFNQSIPIPDVSNSDALDTLHDISLPDLLDTTSAMTSNTIGSIMETTDSAFDMFDFPAEPTENNSKGLANIVDTTPAKKEDTSNSFDFSEDPKEKDEPMLIDNNAFDIFDFPEEAPAEQEIKLMVTSRLQQQPLQPPTLKKRKANSSIRRARSADLTDNIRQRTCQNATGVLKQTKRPLQRSESTPETQKKKRVRFAKNMTVSTFHKMSFDRTEYIEPFPFADDSSNESDSEILPSAIEFSVKPMIDLTNVSNSNLPSSSQGKKRLVGSLKSAHGEMHTTTSMRRFEFDEDDDEDIGCKLDVENLPPTTVQSKEEYMASMEQEINAILGNDVSTDYENNILSSLSSQTDRPRYQPQNAINVRVTYRRSESNRQDDRDDELAQLESMLASLRE